MTATPQSIDSNYQRDWPAYFDAVHDKPPRETLLKALDFFDAETPGDSRLNRTACDLACGEGRDTRELLRRGWRSIAVDSSPLGLSYTMNSLANSRRSDVTPLTLRLEDVPTVLSHVAGLDLVNASFALPFCDPGHFASVWQWIVKSLRPGGRFAGQLFGDRDDWASVRPASHHTRAAVEALLAPFTIEHVEEADKPGGDALGGIKHHHIFHIVARRNDGPPKT